MTGRNSHLQKVASSSLVLCTPLQRTVRPWPELHLEHTCWLPSRPTESQTQNSCWASVQTIMPEGPPADGEPAVEGGRGKDKLWALRLSCRWARGQGKQQGRGATPSRKLSPDNIPTGDWLGHLGSPSKTEHRGLHTLLHRERRNRIVSDLPPAWVSVSKVNSRHKAV